MRRAFVLAILSTFVSACTSLEEASVTNGLSETLRRREAFEVLSPLVRLSHHPEELAFSLATTTGQTSVSNQVVFPNVVAFFQGILLRSATLQNQNQWQQGWSLTAVVDADDVQRLTALMLYGLHPETVGAECNFIKQYTRALVQGANGPVRPSEMPGYGKPAGSRKGIIDADYDVTPPSRMKLPPTEAVQACSAPAGASLRNSHEWDAPLPDQPWICIDTQLSNCGSGFAASDELNDALERPFGSVIFVKRKELAQFQLWALGATPNTLASSSAGSKPASSGGPPAIASTPGR